ncbi:MAG TPA: hypothetical protein VFF06_17470, partial [Polyangia bacterium]|nr:hypothetical protein [Polyangia bacterium]
IQAAVADVGFTNQGAPIGAVAPYPGAVFVTTPQADASLVQLWFRTDTYEPSLTSMWQSSTGR